MIVLPTQLQTIKRYLTICLFGMTLIWGVMMVIGNVVDATMAGFAMSSLGLLWAQAYMIEWAYRRPIKLRAAKSPKKTTKPHGVERSVNAACMRWALLVTVMTVETLVSPMPFALLLWTFLLATKKGPTEAVDVAWKGWWMRIGPFLACALVGLPLVMVLVTSTPAPTAKLYEVLPGVKASLPDLVMALPSVLFALTVDAITRKWFPTQRQKEVAA